ncbi:MAG: efflux RND transporter permease subunit, partial [Rikenellaceae bacterium]|nr:efflux RND transporter permease subunit [Rikenellaceae bacterium]
REIIDEEITLPEGYHVEYGGQFESEEAASRTLAITSILSILVIFMLLYGQFHNATQAAVVLLNLPLALIGGIVSLLLTSQIISIPAIIGFISLFGIATRNGMLLISRYNDLRSEGLSLGEAVLEGSLDRLNPILMTALTSALALIPLALTGDLAGNEIQSPMAQVILGGLVSSTLLNGFVIPIMYILINSKKAKQ